MPLEERHDPKREALVRSGTLHPHPERVTDEQFRDNPFFDPRDGLQVKYEMLRRVRVDGQSVSQAAAAFGLSRPTYYQARDGFEQAGIQGLAPRPKGPQRAHKFSEPVLAFIEAQLAADPGLGADELAARIREQLGVQVHPRSIGRAWACREKKTAADRGGQP